jgi:hypothetical protein
MSLKDKFEIPIECQQCHHKIVKSLRDLEDDPVLTCPECGATTKVTGGGAPAAALDEVQRAFDKLKQAARKSGR